VSFIRYKIFLWKRRILNKKPVSGMHTVVKVDEKKEEKKEEESLF
jgi:hypothetical protein